MNPKFKKSVNLGNGAGLNLGKKGLGLSVAAKGLRVSVGSRGLTTTASIPGTGLKATFRKSLKGSGKPFMPAVRGRRELLSKNIPKDLKSPFYTLQTAAGWIGFLLMLLVFLEPIYFIPAALCLYVFFVWRKRTDPAAVSYKTAYRKYSAAAYAECISALDTVLVHPKADKSLLLVKARCHKNNGNPAAAVKAYSEFFEAYDPAALTDMEYLEYKTEAVKLLIEFKEYDTALKIAQSLSEEEIPGLAVWKNYMKGLCFIGKEQFEAAVEVLRNAVGKKRAMEEPYIDCRYWLGIAYAKLNNNASAFKEFQKVYAANPAYKNVSEIINNTSTSIGKIMNSL